MLILAMVGNTAHEYKHFCVKYFNAYETMGHKLKAALRTESLEFEIRREIAPHHRTTNAIIRHKVDGFHQKQPLLLE